MWADFDGDGDLDLAPTARSEGPSVLYRNDTQNGNHWLEVRLIGRTSNRNGLGAKVRVVTGLGVTPLRQLREIAACSSYGGHAAVEAHFGLGVAALIDSVVVDWPSGIHQVVTGSPADQLLTLNEDLTTATIASPAVTRATAKRVDLIWELSTLAANGYTVERSTDSGAWLTRGPASFDGTRRASFTDFAPPIGRPLRYRLAYEESGRQITLGEIEVLVPTDPARTIPADVSWVRLRSGGDTRVARTVHRR